MLRLTILTIILLLIVSTIAQIKDSSESSIKVQDNPQEKAEEDIQEAPTTSYQDYMTKIKESVSQTLSTVGDKTNQLAGDAKSKVSEIGSNSVDYVKGIDWDKVKEMVTYIVGGILAMVAIALFIYFGGFTCVGVAANSIAACCQGATVAAGSCFAILQSLGATAAFLNPKVLAIGAVLGFLVYIIVQLAS